MVSKPSERERLEGRRGDVAAGESDGHQVDAAPVGLLGHIDQPSSQDLTGLFEQISGSDALRNEYLDAEKAKDDAEEHQMLVFSKKKSVVAEKRQKKEQKEEAEKHMAALEELKALKTEQVVWELYVLEHDLARFVAENV